MCVRLIVKQSFDFGVWKRAESKAKFDRNKHIYIGMPCNCFQELRSSNLNEI